MYLVPLSALLLVVLSVSLCWVRGLEYMDTHHPDYDGQDFLDDRID